MTISKSPRACGICLAVAMLLAGCSAFAQTLATGDTRTVAEPTFPVACAVLTAQQAVVAGGPASETITDTARIQAALTGCAAGQAVELAGSGTNFAFLTAPLNIPSGVSLIVDGGVTLFASRVASDYQTSSSELCGTFGSNGNGCNALFSFNRGSSNANSGIYGYGVIDGRGGSTILTSTYADTGISWWTNADNANTAGKSQDNFIFMKPSRSTNLTLYKITLRNSPMFHVAMSGVTGFTAWGVKIQAPFTAHNTDGIDPQGTNITITNSSISDGDDDIAVGASSASANVTISNVTTYSGHGISVGSYTQGGLNNMLVKNVNMAGTAADGNSTGLRLKSAADRGSVVQNITYQNVCIRDTRYPIIVTGYYNTNSGNLIPTYTNVVYTGVHVLPPTSTKYPYKLQFQGYDANHISTLTFNNVSIETLAGVSSVAGTTSPSPAYTTLALANNVYPAFLSSLTGTGFTETGAAATSVAANTGDCTAISTIFPYIVGEFYASTASATNLQSATVATGNTLTLNAMLQPAMSQSTFNGTVGSYTGAAAPTAGVDFYLGATKVGTATLSTTSNGTLASLALTSPAAGTYTAKYQGDSNYSAISFGSVAVTVPVGAATTDVFSINPATITYGAYPTLTSTVSSASGTPSGTITYNEGSTAYAGGTLSGGTIATSALLFAGGTHTLTSTYSGNATYSTSTSTAMTLIVNQANTTTTVSATPNAITANGSTTLNVTVTGSPNPAAAYPSGTISFADGSTSLGSVALGNNGTASLPVTLTTSGARTITATYSGDSNYLTSFGITPVTVSSATSTTVLTAPATLVYGTLPMLSAAVTAASGTPAGSVVFYDGATPLGSAGLASGVATLTPANYLTGGTHSLSAVYSGDTTFGTSTGTASSTVTTATTATALAASANFITAGGQVTLTATVTGVAGAAAPGGKVTFADNGTTLGTATLSSGTASLPVTLPNAGSRTLTATYAGDANYAASSGSTAETVNYINTATALAPASLATYPGASVTLTATVTSGGAPFTTGTTVYFYNGIGLLGTAPLNSSGVASYTFSAGTSGTTYSLSAVNASTGNYASSTSNTSTVTVGAPFMLGVTPATLNIAAGSSATASVALAAANGYTGAVSYTCSSPVSYITCTPASGSVAAGAGSLTITIAVAATKSSLAVPGNGTVYAWLLPVSLIGLFGAVRRRKLLNAVMLALVALVVTTGVIGCGGSSAASATLSNKPTGSYNVTVTATAAGVTQSSTITVNIQ